MNFEQARFNMVEQQIRPWEVTSQDVRELLMSVRREDYVPTKARALAFADVEIPLPKGQAMLKPVIEGRILQALDIDRIDRTNTVLEIGTGSGYFAALLAARAGTVHTIEIRHELIQLARDNFAKNGVTNVSVEAGDGAQGWAARAPYDIIVVSGGLIELPESLPAQLKPGGRLFAFVGEAPIMKGRLIVREDEQHFTRRDLFETVVPMLRHIPPDRFRF
jgi:protein-L-isoaspartate(D-aspartate) O-methyltransferase